MTPLQRRPRRVRLRLRTVELTDVRVALARLLRLLSTSANAQKVLPFCPARLDDSANFDRLQATVAWYEDGDDRFPVPVFCRLSVVGDHNRVVGGGKPDRVRRRVASSRRPGVRRQTVSIQGDLQSTMCSSLQGLLDKFSCLLSPELVFYGLLKSISLFFPMRPSYVTHCIRSVRPSVCKR